MQAEQRELAELRTHVERMRVGKEAAETKLVELEGVVRQQEKLVLTLRQAAETRGWGLCSFYAPSDGV